MTDNETTGIDIAGIDDSEPALVPIINRAPVRPDSPTFAELGVRAETVEALAKAGITRAFAIQEYALPIAMRGTDLIGQAPTGTGKTLGFGLPILERVLAPSEGADGVPQALIVVPTRELGLQVARDLAAAGSTRGIRVLPIYGGVAYESQVDVLKKGVEILVGTPGRLLDLAKQKQLKLSSVKALVLDEADRMLDLGFLDDVEKILAMLPAQRQTMLFSATMPDPIVALSRRFLHQPVTIHAGHTADSGPSPLTKQVVYRTHPMNKVEMVARILQARGRGLTMIFTRTKRAADRLAEDLDFRGFAVAAVHGDLGQGARERALRAFRAGKIDVLVATDVAARGLDVSGVTHVINFDCPEDPETYTHRIGRTGRAGATGVAITFVDWEDMPRWVLIDKSMNLNMPQPPETYHTSPDLYTDLDIPNDISGTLPTAERSRAGLSAEIEEDLGGGRRRERGGSRSSRGPRRPGDGGGNSNSGGSSGTSSAGSHEDQADRPQRQRRRRKVADDTPAVGTTTTGTPTLGTPVAGSPESADGDSSPRSSRRRRRRGAGDSPVDAALVTDATRIDAAPADAAPGADAVAEAVRASEPAVIAEPAPLAVPESTPVSTEDSAAKPARTRTRRKTTEEPAPATAVAEAVPAEEPAPAPRTRTRRAKVTEATEPAAPALIEPAQLDLAAIEPTALVEGVPAVEPAPAAKTRARRTKATEEAAPAAVLVEDAPAAEATPAPRTRTRRTKVTEPAAAEPVTPTLIEPAALVEGVPADEPAPAAKTRARRTKAAEPISAPAETAPVENAPAVNVAPAADATASAPAARAPRTRRTAKAAAETATEAPAVTSRAAAASNAATAAAPTAAVARPAVTAPIGAAQAPALAASAGTEELGEGRRRVAGIPLFSNAAAATEEAPASHNAAPPVSFAAPPVTPGSQSGVDDSSDDRPAPSSAGNNSRRRGGRSTRGGFGTSA